MVAVTWALIALSGGLLTFLSIGLVASILPAPLRAGVARWQYGLAMRSYGQAVIVWRDLGGPELMSMQVDDEEKVANATLSSGVLSDDKQLPFRDPDNRMYRLQGKSLTIVPETMPAAVDAEVAELGHWHREHRQYNGVESGDGIDPWVEVGPELRAANPLDAIEIAPNGVAPENINSTREHTKERFSKYGRAIGVAETAGVITGFGAGAFGMLGLQYMRQSLLGPGTGGGGGGIDTTVPIPPGMLSPETVQPLIDVAPMVIA